ncbi:hypothetical protein JCM10914_2738 [Paenibacillus sp. JCM 10914]|nr:hypothetical protein JCM10914_2738 [Paenibacillus sp. JCM 10914]
MAIKEIQKYAQLRAAGDCTLQERLEILLQHQVVLKQDISKMQEHLANLEDKIKYYITEMKEER